MMTLPRTSIAALMVLTALIAVATAALRKPSPIWAGGLVTLAFGMILLAFVAVLLGGGRRRAIATGFAVCGGGYFAFSFLGPGADNVWLLSSSLIEVTSGAWQTQPDKLYLVYRVADSLGSIAFGLIGGLYASSLTPAAGSASATSHPTGQP